MTTDSDFTAIREAMASFPGEVATDAHGVQAPRLEEFFAPESHAAALDPKTLVVQGARGSGKSFWAGVLLKDELRKAAAAAYPRLGLEKIDVSFGFTGLAGPGGLGKDRLDSLVPATASADEMRTFWWATILAALERTEGGTPSLDRWMTEARDIDRREALITERDSALEKSGATLLIVYDALDTSATSWDRRRQLTQALLEVVWAMRAWRFVRPKLFLRPDQLEDEGLRFVELPKIKTGAVRLKWMGTELYGLLFSRLALGDARDAFGRVLASESLPIASREDVLARRWLLSAHEENQRRLMAALAGQYMSSGVHGYKKGDTYSWPLNHLGDAFGEVTPRSFLGLAISAASFGQPPPNRVFTPEGIRHGLRSASKTRVDQLQIEFPWIKGVLAPLAGLLLPQDEEEVFAVWRRARTVKNALRDADLNHYLPPFPPSSGAEGERALYEAMERIGVMFRRRDGRLDMPDLFRVAAKLLKKGGTAPL